MTKATQLANFARSLPDRFSSGSAFEAWVAANPSVPDGSVVAVGGLQYRRSAGATALSDRGLPGWLPAGAVAGAGIVYAGHFGAPSDMTYEERETYGFGDDVGVLTGEIGYFRLTGTDNRAAIVAADAYAASIGAHLWFQDGGYYYRDEIRPLTRWMSESDFGVTLWQQYQKVNAAGVRDEPGDPQFAALAQSGLALYQNNTGLGVPGAHGFNIISQFSAFSLKDTGQGHLGTAIRVNDYYTAAAQPITRDIFVRAKLTRAMIYRDISGVIQQRSAGSILIAQMAGVEDFGWEIGVFGKSNIKASHLKLDHWGARADLSGFASEPFGVGFTPAPLIETYHSLDGYINFLGPLNNKTNGLKMNQPYELAATGSVRVGPVTTYGHTGGGLGGGLGAVTCGDVVDAYTVPSQRGRVGKGIRIAQATAYDCLPSAGDEMFYVKGGGTAKNPADVEPGTSVPKQRQQKNFDIKCDGFYVEFDTEAEAFNPALGNAVFIHETNGRVDLGTVTTIGCHRGIEIENSDGYFTGRLRGDGCMIVNFAKGVDDFHVETDRGNFALPDEEAFYGFGWAGPNTRAVEMTGKLIANLGRSESVDVPALLASAVSQGDTEIFLDNPTSQRTYIGDEVFVGTARVFVTEMQAVGALRLATTAFPIGVAAEEVVTVIQRATMRRPKFGFSSSRLGIVMANYGEALECDLSNIGYTGQHIARLRTSCIMTVTGGRLPPTGRMNDVNRRTFRLENDAHVSLIGVDCPDYSSDIISHLQMVDTSTALVDTCKIQNVTRMAATSGATIDRVRWVNNRDYAGSPVYHPSQNGVWTPTLEIGGVAVTSYSSNREGNFSNLGNGLMRVEFDFSITSRESLTGLLTITGLPAAQVGRSNGFLSIAFASLTTASPFILADGNVFRFFRQATSGISQLNETQITDTSRFSGSIIYRRA